MSQRLSRWRRFRTCFLPVLVNGLPAGGLGVWCGIHSAACAVAFGLPSTTEHCCVLPLVLSAFGLNGVSD